MSIGTLYTTPGMGSGKAIRAAAALGGLQLELPSSYTHFEDNKKPEFTGKFPHGKIPGFDGADGFKLFEGAAIARYVASLAPNSGLLGGDAKDAALVDQWVHFVESEIAVAAGLVGGLVRGAITPYSKPIHTTFLERVERALATLNTFLLSRTFLVGERITLADLFTASVIGNLTGTILGAAERTKYSNVVRHFETVINHPKISEIYGKYEYIEKPLQYTAPAKEKKPAQEKPAAAPKAEKKPKKAEEDDEEPDVPAEPKAKNPLDELPKPTMAFDDWKRAYSNMDTRGENGALEWLYKNIDKEGYSIWRVDFKYNEELTQTFMSANQVGGFFNRLEASRKYLFASVGVLGTANNSIITGALIARGKDIVPVVNVAPDWESYEYKPLDLENPEDKKFFEGALAWDLEVDGKTWVDGKNFK